MDVIGDFEVWYRALVGYCAQRCDEPEDVAQEALIRCALAQRRGQALNRAYVFMTARSCVVDLHRQRREQLEYVRELVAGYVDSNLSLAETLADDPLALLKPGQAEVAVLTAAGYRDREIGALLGCSGNSVRKRRFYGRQRAGAGR